MCVNYVHSFIHTFVMYLNCILKLYLCYTAMLLYCSHFAIHCKTNILVFFKNYSKPSIFHLSSVSNTVVICVCYHPHFMFNIPICLLNTLHVASKIHLHLHIPWFKYPFICLSSYLLFLQVKHTVCSK